MDINSIREACGTIPFDSEENNKEFRFIEILDAIQVYIVDTNINPYRVMFSAATATWGDNEYSDKWPDVHTKDKLEVIKGVLCEKTLPQAREMVNFVFRVRGTPRWLFDYHVTNTPFLTAMSIGCRDNNKFDTDIIHIGELDEKEKEVHRDLRNIYSNLVFDSKNRESWQTARAFLPQNYQHSYHFGQNLLSISRMKFNDAVEGQCMKILYARIIEKIDEQFPLIALYLRDAIFNGGDFSNIKNMTESDLDPIDYYLI